MPIRSSRGVLHRAELSSNLSEPVAPQSLVWISARSLLFLSAELITTSAYLGRVCVIVYLDCLHSLRAQVPSGCSSRQARFPKSAVPYFGVWLAAISLDGTRAGRWIPLLLAKLSQELSSKYEYATSGSVSSGPWRWMPPGVVDGCADAFEFLGARNTKGLSSHPTSSTPRRGLPQQRPAASHSRRQTRTHVSERVSTSSERIQ